ncbi:potassium channel family protein [Streptomyces sp. WSLK1-5]|uniref:potassium channel family protein n=1 Tax=unclassified Streptomyces TaxID=2593676 RepID=UPI003788F65D
MATDTPTRPGRREVLLSVARSTGTATGLVVAYYLLPLDQPMGGGTTAGLVLGLLGVTALFIWQVRTIVRSPHPQLRAVETLAAVASLYVLLFATSYFLLEHDTPGSFTEPVSRTDALYFALTVLSTVGFGDITARSGTARVMTMAQIVGGILLAGVAVRVVVGAIQAGLRRHGQKDP